MLVVKIKNWYPDGKREEGGYDEGCKRPPKGGHVCEQRREGHLIISVPVPFVVFKKLIGGLAVFVSGRAAVVIVVDIHLFCCFERGS